MAKNDFKNALYSVYQPLVSIRDHTIAGFEALIRNNNGTSPAEMIASARRDGTIVDFDRKCRMSALENFTFEWSSRFLLSINFNGDVINEKTLGSNNLLEAVKSTNFNPENIIIEILETDVGDIEKLCVFASSYREKGFLIALDDVGSGSSNLNRIPLIRPDIIKIDRFLTDNYRQDFYKLEVLKSLIALSHKIGAVIIAEGIERIEQAVDLTLLGVDLLQGYYFSHPQKCSEINFSLVSQRLEECADACRVAAVQAASGHRHRHNMLELCAREILESDFSASVILEIIRKYPDVECAYFLTDRGIQKSETVCDMENLRIKNRLLFFPAGAGSDHSLKDYFLNADVESNGYMTQPYVSKATGRLCVTRSQYVRFGEENLLLCIDAAADPVNGTDGMVPGVFFSAKCSD